MLPKVSINKNGDGAGCATPKDPTIIVVDVDDVASEPTRVVGNTVLQGDLELKEALTSTTLLKAVQTRDSSSLSRSATVQPTARPRCTVRNAARFS